MDGTKFDSQEIRKRKKSKREIPKKIKIFKNFTKDLEHIKKGLEIIEELKSNKELEKDLKNNLLLNIYQGKIMILFGGIDLFFHELIPEKVVNILENNDEIPNDNIKNLKISLDTFFKYMNSESEKEKRDILSKGIKKEINYITYSSNIKNMKKILETIGNRDIFKEIAHNLGYEYNFLEGKLKIYSLKRNEIAHRLQYDSEKEIKKDTTKEELLEMIEFYEKLFKEIERYI